MCINRSGQYTCEEGKPMEKFLALPQERQEYILAAAMRIFGSVGYKKAYVSDVAKEAGISKALVFHYFSNKKTLYLYLLDHTYTIMTSEMNDKSDNTKTDFFDRIADATKKKLSVMKRYPAVNDFLKSVYFETDQEVLTEIREVLSRGENVRSQIAFDGVDKSKFKDEVDPQLVLNILVKFSEGYANASPSGFEADIDTLIREFEASVALMKNNFYKEEYLL
jgi:AcrR family transcriptional regulator